MDHLIEKNAKKKEPQTPQQHQEYDRRISFYPTPNSPGKQHDRKKQRQSTLFQPHKFDQAEKIIQNQSAAAKKNSTDAANPAFLSKRFQSEKRVQSKFQYTSPAPQSQQFAFRQPTDNIPSAPTYVAAFGPTYISAANSSFSAANPAFSAAIPAFAPSGYAKKIANLTKLYTEKMKYEKKNDNFEHKFTLFHHFCSKTDLFHEVRSKALFFMLKGFALDYYLVNVNMLENVTLNQTCTFISTHFENLDNKKNNLQK